MDTFGMHLLLDVWLDEPWTEGIKDRVIDYIRAKFNVVRTVEKKFRPVGDTVVLILSESHFSIHTYPEHNYLTMDLYICNKDVDLHVIKAELLDLMRVKKINSQMIERGTAAHESHLTLSPAQESSA